jgi:hypothetical protein
VPKRIPVSVAANVGKGHACRQVVVVAWDGDLTHVVTWGDTPEMCAQAAEGGNALKKALGWPEKLCDTQPSAIKKLRAEVKRLEAELESALWARAME